MYIDLKLGGWAMGKQLLTVKKSSLSRKIMNLGVP